MVESAIRQTRCAACDTEHVFKGGLPPKPRRREDLSGGSLVVPDAGRARDSVGAASSVSASPPDNNGHGNEPSGAPNVAGDEERPGEVWHGHRPLIRATLPRVEGAEPPPRVIPEFTMHQRNVRGGHAFRQGQPWHDRSDNQRGRQGSSFGGHGGHGGRGGGFANGNGNGGSNGDPNGNSDGGASRGQGGAPGQNHPGEGRRRRRHRGRKPDGPR